MSSLAPRAAWRTRQVVLEFDRAHRALSEEGSYAWFELFEAMRRIRLAPLFLMLLIVIGPMVFYVYIFLPCWECYDFTAALTHVRYCACTQSSREAVAAPQPRLSCIWRMRHALSRARAISSPHADAIGAVPSPRYLIPSR